MMQFIALFVDCGTQALKPKEPSVCLYHGFCSCWSWDGWSPGDVVNLKGKKPSGDRTLVAHFITTGHDRRRKAFFPTKLTPVSLLQCSVSCGGGVRTRSVTCAKNHNEPCDKTRKPNSRALCGLQQCPSSRRVLKLKKDVGPGGKNQPTSEDDPFRPIPAPTSRPTPLSTTTVPESVSRSTTAISSPGPTLAPEEEPDETAWQKNSTQTKDDSYFPTSSGSPSQAPLTSWSVSIQPDDENVSSSAIGPTSEDDVGTTTSDSGLSFSHAVTWQVTPFYDTLTPDPEVEIHSGSGEDSDQPMNKDENHSVIWNKVRAPDRESPVERKAEIPLEPPPTSYVGEETSWPPFSTMTEGLPPDWSLKNETPRAEGVITEKPRNISLPSGGGHQPKPSEKLENHGHLALPNDTNPAQGSGPVLTEEDASSLIAEGFLLNASNYKQLVKDHSPAYWIVGNWSKVRDSVSFSRPDSMWIISRNGILRKFWDELTLSNWAWRHAL